MGAMRWAVLAFVALQAVGYGGTASVVANPIRKVVRLLQLMQTKITAEGEKETQLYDKFQCYCKNSGGDLTSTITAADGKIPQVETHITEAEILKVKLQADVKQQQADRDAAKNTMAEASQVRESEAAAFAKQKAQYDSNIDALQKATVAVTTGMAGGFLQTSTAQILHKLVLTKQDIPDTDRQELLTLFSASQTGRYVPKGGEVAGILSQLHDDMVAELADLTANEEGVIKTFFALVAAKKKQVGALTASIEEKMTRVSKLGLDIVTMKGDLSDTQQALLEDRKFLAELDKNCASKQSEWEKRKRTRAEELAAIAETIKVLNDDDALDLFKKTLSASASASFVQVKAKTAVVKRAIVRIIHGLVRVEKHRPELDFLALMIQGKKISFEKVIQMIDTMVTNLKTEQQDDNNKKEYCAAQFDSTDDQKKGLKRSVSDLENALAEAEEGLATVKEEIKALEGGIKALDKEVMEATEQRKEEHAGYTELIVSNSAAKKLLNFAKNTLNRFYNPALYKAPEKRELTEPDRIAVNLGGEAPPNPAPSGIAGTGIAVLAQKDAPSPPPETFGAYASKGKENTGVIAMIDLLIKELDKDMTEAETEEKNAQEDYEKLMNDAAGRRAADQKSITLKKSTKAGLEIDIAEHTDLKQSTSKELMATLKYIQSLHVECDWLLQYFDVRKKARATEADQLKEAKAVLSGADFSLL